MAQIALPKSELVLQNSPGLRGDMAIRRVGKVILTIMPWLGYLFLWLPILVLILFSFNQSRTNAVWNGFTLDWYKLLLSGQFSTEKRLSTQYLIQAMGNSAFVAFFSTLIATMLGTTVALGMERLVFRGRRALDLLLYLPVVIPEVTMGLSLLLFFSGVFRGLNQLTGSQLALSLTTVALTNGVPFAMSRYRCSCQASSRAGCWRSPCRWTTLW